jgi:hypothetical protein
MSRREKKVPSSGSMANYLVNDHRGLQRHTFRCSAQDHSNGTHEPFSGDSCVRLLATPFLQAP